MSKRRRSGFSLMEVIAAVIILAVVATATVATVAPMRDKSRQKMEETTLAALNGMAQSYYMELGSWPSAAAGVEDLAAAGYIDSVNQPATYTQMIATFEWDDTTKRFRKIP